jgi:hypothetical protein
MNSDGTPKAIGQLDPRGPDHAWSSAVKNDVLDNVVGTIYHTQDN